MDKNAERVSVALIKLAEIGAAVVAQQKQAEQFEKRAYMVPLLAGAGAGIYTFQQMRNDADLQSKLDALEQQPSLSADDVLALNALLDRHRNSNVDLAAAGISAVLGGALAGGAIGGAVAGGIGGWAGKRISAATSQEAQRARAILKNYNAE